jgi:ribosomal protein L37AE/L43A
MQTKAAVRCPACGSAQVTDRRRGFWIIAGIMVVAIGAVVLNGVTEGWGWAAVVGLIGAAFVALANTLAAIAAPWRCDKCRRVWRG